MSAKYDRKQACQETFACDAEIDSSNANWRNIGFFRYEMDACTTPEHTTQEHAIIIVNEPLEIKRRLGGELREELIYPDRNVIINPAHVPQSGEWHHPASFSIIFLDPKIVAHAFHESIDPDDVEILPHFSQTDPVINSLAVTLADCLADDLLNRLYAESTAVTLALHLIRTYGSKKFELPTDRKNTLSDLEKTLIIDYLQVNLHTDLSLFSMASQVNKSARHFRRCFFTTFGQSLCDYVKDLRLNKAMGLLKANSAMKIEDVARQVGLNTTSFRRLFRSKFGISASSCREF
jgi:AraC family transcriptional regulator